MPCLSFTLVLDSAAGPEAKVHSVVITGVYAACPRRTFAPSLLLPIDRNLCRCLGFLDGFKGTEDMRLTIERNLRYRYNDIT